MVFVDNRAGSADFAPLLRSQGLPVTLTRMAYGDVSFMGYGPDGAPVGIGIEVKTISDVLSCITTGRFAGHQLPGLVEAYDYIWLLMVGLYRPHPRTGLLQLRRGPKDWRDAAVGSRRFMYRDLLTWLWSMSIKGGIRLVRASAWDEATMCVSSLYAWWTKGWDKHQSHLAFHDGTRHGAPYYRGKRVTGDGGQNGSGRNGTAGTGSRGFDSALLMRPTLVRMLAAQLPNVGFEKSKAIAERFRTAEELIAADEQELASLPGIGPVIAHKIWESLRSSK